MMKKVERPRVFGRLYTTLFDLNAEEQKLLESFNKVPKEQHPKVLEIIEVIAKANAKSEQHKTDEENIKWKANHDKEWQEAKEATKDYFKSVYGTEDKT